MRRRWILRWLALAASAFAGAAAARTEPPLTFRSIHALPLPAVALRLLGPERGADIERIETRPASGPLPVALEVYLYARPVPLGPSYCSQRWHLLSLTNAGPPALRGLRHGEPLRVIFSDEWHSVARAPGCRLAPGQRFASLDAAADADLAMRVLDGLASAQAAALAPGPMGPIALTCRDEIESDPDRCGAGARDALAHLPLDQACAVSAGDDAPRNVEITLCTDGPQWVLHQLMAGSDPPQLLMVWKYPDGGY
jgi:hypothetical protein